MCKTIQLTDISMSVIVIMIVIIIIIIIVIIIIISNMIIIIPEISVNYLSPKNYKSSEN
jgi:hypothetical protein